MLPVFVIGGLIISSAGRVITRDITQVWTTAAARSEVAYERRQGRSKLLLVRDLDVSYGGVQVLFDVNLEVDEGEIIALLGTNGAGKSTLLRTISGIVEADRGAIIFDGVDMTATPPAEIAGRGVLQVPGGVARSRRSPCGRTSRWPAGCSAATPRRRSAAIERVLGLFPVLETRQQEPAANLSGGQQQQLALGMAFLSKPRLLMIDELSLGLAPVIVEQLLPLLRELRDAGHDDHPRRAVGERGPHGGRDGVLHGEGRDPVLGRHRRPPRAARPPALGVPRGRRARATGGGRPASPRAPRRATNGDGRGADARRGRAGAADRRPHPVLRRASERSTTCPISVAPRRGRRDHRSQRRGQDHALRRDLRLHARGQRPDPPRRPRHQRARRRTSGPSAASAARSRTPACSRP